MKRVKKTGLKTFNNSSFIVSVMSVIVAVVLSFSAIILSQRQGQNLSQNLAYALNVTTSSFKDKTTYQLTPTQNNFTLREYAFTDLVDATTLVNTDTTKTVQSYLTTTDLVWLPMNENVEISSSNISSKGNPTGINTMIYNLTGETSSSTNRIANITDFAIANYSAGLRANVIGNYWLRTPDGASNSQYINYNGNVAGPNYTNSTSVARPAMQFNLNTIISSKEQLNIKIEEDSPIGTSTLKTHTITIPNIMYPQTKVPSGSTLETNLNNAGGITSSTQTTVTPSSTLTATGIRYKTYTRTTSGPADYAYEYYYKGSYYAYGRVYRYGNSSTMILFSDETEATVADNSYAWFKVEPIVWYITNWNSLPTSFTGEANGGTDTEIIVLSKYSLLNAGRFYDGDDGANTLWQNSNYRAFLNGYNLAEQNNGVNGNADYATEFKSNYKGEGFAQVVWHNLKPSLISNATLTNNGYLSNGDAIIETETNSLTTTDLVWLPSQTEMNNMATNIFGSATNETRRATPTDFVKSNYAYTYYNNGTNDYSPYDSTHGTALYFIRSLTNKYVRYVNRIGVFDAGNDNAIYIGSRPVMQLNLSTLLSYSINYQVDSVNKTITLQNLMYPQTIVEKNSSLEQELTFAFNNDTGNGSNLQYGMVATGRVYAGYREKYNAYVYDELLRTNSAKEYFYNGSYYVRKLTLTYTGSIYSDNTSANEYRWFKVEPIVWYITNWDDMPNTINPSSSYTESTTPSSTITLLSQYVIAAIGEPTYAYTNNTILWQNSRTRAYLNGYNLFEQNAIMGNGNINYLATDANTGAFSDNNFTSFKGEGFIDTLWHETSISFLTPTTLQNTGFKSDDTAIDTTTNNLTTMDYVWLPSYEGVDIDSSNVSTAGDPTGINTMIYNLTGVKSSGANRIATPTDFMVANKADISNFFHSKYNTTQGSSHYWIRSSYSAGQAQYIHAVGNRYTVDPTCAGVAARPAMKLNLNSVISARSQLGILIGLDTSMGENAHTITIPNIMYPQTKVPAGSTLEQELDSAGGITARTSSTVTPSETLTKTGVTYRGYNGSWQEYKYKNNYYVYAKVNKGDATTYKFSDEFANGATVLDNTNYVWFKVEPIVWYITNWNSLPKSFTGENTEIATPDQQLILLSQYAIVNVGAYYPSSSDDYRTMWQNSRFRAYLNGYDLSQQNTYLNGNPSYNGAQISNATYYPFANNGFLQTIWHDLQENSLIDILNQTTIDNAVYTSQTEYTNVQTSDYVYLPSKTEIESYYTTSSSRIITPTDYALANKANLNPTKHSTYNSTQGSTFYWLRSSVTNTILNYVDYSGNINSSTPMHSHNSSVLALNFNIANLLNSNIDYTIDATNKTITFPNILYPQTKVTGDLEITLNHTYSSPAATSFLYKTGRFYAGLTSWEGGVQNTTYNEEYYYEGNYYVRTLVQKYNSDYTFSNGQTSSNGSYIWVKAEPIVWNITNWSALPSQLNSSGSGSALTISCLSKYALVSIGYYYPNITDNYGNTWQNSTIRAYLNGYSIADELNVGNGSTTYQATVKPTFKGLGFVDTIWHNFVSN